MVPQQAAPNGDAPDNVDLASARDLRGRTKEIWVRRALATLLAVIPVVALFNVFGQRASDSHAQSPEATLTVHAPENVRGGLLFEARFTITAREDIKKAVLELSPQWANGLTINTLEPAPSEESSENGWLSLELGPIPAGDRFELHLQYQVNPTSHGGRDLGVRLLDDTTLLTTANRHLQVWP
jgi:hypothetical protein